LVGVGERYDSVEKGGEGGGHVSDSVDRVRKVDPGEKTGGVNTKGGVGGEGPRGAKLRLRGGGSCWYKGHMGGGGLRPVSGDIERTQDGQRRGRGKVLG